jgi:hypothetical protein
MLIILNLFSACPRAYRNGMKTSNRKFEEKHRKFVPVGISGRAARRATYMDAGRASSGLPPKPIIATGHLSPAVYIYQKRRAPALTIAHTIFSLHLSPAIRICHLQPELDMCHCQQQMTAYTWPTTCVRH